MTLKPDPARGSHPRLLRLALFPLGLGACFGAGWLAFRLMPPGQEQLTQQALIQQAAGAPDSGAAHLEAPALPAPTSGDTGGLLPQARSAMPEGQALSGRGPLAAMALPSPSMASLRCLAGGSPEIAAPAEPSNYGDRQATDWRGEPVRHTPSLIVLHETVVDEKTALALFQRHQNDDGQQASYHVLIGLDGRRIRVVDDDRRAFGAGDSAFEGQAVQLRQAIPASVNNFALHVSLVSPKDGADGDRAAHSGYTPAQYDSLARQIALWQSRYGIPASQVTTHQEVDRSGTRHDPRSFDWNALGRNLRRQLLACSGAAPVAATSGTPASSPRP